MEKEDAEVMKRKRSMTITKIYIYKRIGEMKWNHEYIRKKNVESMGSSSSDSKIRVINRDEVIQDISRATIQRLAKLFIII